MADPGQSPSVAFLHTVSGLLADPDDALVRVARRPLLWVGLYGAWLGVLGCFVAGGYPAIRTLVLALAMVVFPSVAAVLAARRPALGERRRLAIAFPWAAGVQAVLMAAVTGGLHSPFALVLFLIFSSLYARYGWSRAGRLVLALFGGGVLCMAVAPRGWTGPTLLDPWFTVAASIAALGSMAVQAHFVGTLRRTAAQAVREKLRARDELAEHALARARELELVGSKLSHELNNPLAAIKALVQVAHRSIRDPILERQLEVVESEIERMSFILQSYLGFSRPLDAYAPVEVELADVAEAVLSLLEGRANAAAVSLEQRGNARAMVDPKRVRGALLNLVANAIDACGRGGRVEIAVTEVGGSIRVAVVDNGRGMAPEVARRVGTPFFTTRERGTGLGVVLARAAFEQHGGTLEYRTAPGQGTTVVGTLPRARGGTGSGAATG